MNANKTVYRLTIADVQNVAEDTLDRKLSDVEVASVAERIRDTVNWYDPIWSAVIELDRKELVAKSSTR